MSFIASNAVWSHSKQKSGRLIVLLKLADFANDQGISWPAVSTLAKYARISERHVQRCLEKLQRDGELKVIHNGGPKSSNLYKICLPLIKPEQGDANVSPDIAVAAPVTPVSSNSDVSGTQSVNESSIEPTPIVPKGDDKEFWIKICFENCFKQKPHPLPGYLINRLGRMLPYLKKAYAGSLVAFYRSYPLDTKPPPPFNSRRHSPERLILDLHRQLALAVKQCPPSPPKKPEPPRWQEFFRWKNDNPNIVLPTRFEQLDKDLRIQYENEFEAFEVATAGNQVEKAK
jgi:Helix-turn-helix domain